MDWDTIAERHRTATLAPEAMNPGTKNGPGFPARYPAATVAHATSDAAAPVAISSNVDESAPADDASVLTVTQMPAAFADSEGSIST